MWSRVVEVMFGCWLAVSPFVFGHIAGDTAQWGNDLACAATVITLALLSFYHPLRYAHLLLIPVGLWLIVNGYLHFGGEIAPPVQNNVLVGWLLLMFAVIPNHASVPPPSWQQAAPQVEGKAAERKQAHRSAQEEATAKETAKT